MMVCNVINGEGVLPMMVGADVIPRRCRCAVVTGIAVAVVAAATACAPGMVQSADSPLPPATEVPAQHAGLRIQLITSAADGDAEVAEAAAAAAAAAGHRQPRSPWQRVGAVVRHLTSALMMRAAGR